MGRTEYRRQAPWHSSRLGNSKGAGQDVRSSAGSAACRHIPLWPPALCTASMAQDVCLWEWTAALRSLIVLFGMLAAASVVPAQPATQAAGGNTGNVTLLSAAQLDQLTAPIALYPDPLLAQILAAATYPLEIVQAARWLEDPAHTALTGSDLSAALEPLNWDQSVKSLVTFPDVLRNLNSNLEWTEQLGDAFLAQQSDVMDSVQRLRRRAADSGSLRSTPQQIVTDQDNALAIEPANPEVVYVPYYVPAEVYAPWPWPGYAPYYWAPWPGINYSAGLIWFGTGFPVLGRPYWGWWGWNWPAHGFVVYPQPVHYPRHGPVVRAPADAAPAKPWQHNPFHRRGVPYRDVVSATRYLGPQGVWSRPYRGYPPSPALQLQRPAGPVHAPVAPRVPSTPPRPQATPYVQPVPRLGPAPRAPVSRPAAPAFESFGRGPQVRGEAARGSSSLSAPRASHGAAPRHH